MAKETDKAPPVSKRLASGVWIYNAHRDDGKYDEIRVGFREYFDPTSRKWMLDGFVNRDTRGNPSNEEPHYSAEATIPASYGFDRAIYAALRNAEEKLVRHLAFLRKIIYEYEVMLGERGKEEEQ